jgi:hypothetical protein
MKKNIVICLFAFSLLGLLESCNNGSSRNKSHSYNSSAKTDHTFDAIDDAIRAGEIGNQGVGIPPLSEEMQQLRYRCETLNETDACEEWIQYSNQSVRGMNQEIQRIETEKE